MHRLSGEDAGFLSMESADQAMNTIAVGIVVVGPYAVWCARVILREVRRQ